MWIKSCLTLMKFCPFLTQKIGRGVVTLFISSPVLRGQGWVVTSGHCGCKCFTGEMKILPSAELGIRVPARLFWLSLLLHEQGSSFCGPIGSTLFSTAHLPVFKFLKPFTSSSLQWATPWTRGRSGSSSRWACLRWLWVLPACPQTACEQLCSSDINGNAGETSLQQWIKKQLLK